MGLLGISGLTGCHDGLRGNTLDGNLVSSTICGCVDGTHPKVGIWVGHSGKPSDVVLIGSSGLSRRFLVDSFGGIFPLDGEGEWWKGTPG